VKVTRRSSQRFPTISLTIPHGLRALNCLEIFDYMKAIHMTLLWRHS
jgi:hypothetical protein